MTCFTYLTFIRIIDGSVNAPDWVIPVGAVAVILTAALPILLRPGEEALDQMREDEDGKTNFR